MGMILRIASSRIVGQGDIVGRSGYFSLNLSANSVMRGRLDARRTLKSLVADLRLIYFLQIYLQNENLAYYASRMKQQYTSPLGATLKSILLSSFQDRLSNSLYNI